MKILAAGPIFWDGSIPAGMIFTFKHHGHVKEIILIAHSKKCSAFRSRSTRCILSSRNHTHWLYKPSHSNSAKEGFHITNWMANWKKIIHNINLYPSLALGHKEEQMGNTYGSAPQIRRVLKKPRDKIYCFWGHALVEYLCSKEDCQLNLRVSCKKLAEIVEQRPGIHLMPGVGLDLWEFKLRIVWVHTFDFLTSWCTKHLIQEKDIWSC